MFEILFFSGVKINLLLAQIDLATTDFMLAFSVLVSSLLYRNFLSDDTNLRFLAFVQSLLFLEISSQFRDENLNYNT